MKLTIPPHAHADERFGDWTLYRLQDDGRGSFLWPGFKLMLPIDTPIRRGLRRAYWLTWSVDELRMRRDGQSLALEREHADLAKKVEVHMSLNYGPEWLTDPDGAAVSVAEIDAERERLRALAAAARAGRRRPFA